MIPGPAMERERSNPSPQDKPTRDVESMLTPLLVNLLRPLKVRGLTFTRSTDRTVYGVLTTWCPVERQVSTRDIEVRFNGPNSGKITSLWVDGRKVFPEPKPKTLRRGTSMMERETTKH